jgi:hypothetical protein
MSIIRCEGHSPLCIDLIDTDIDQEAFCEVGNMRRMDRTLVLCHACRDHREAMQDRGDAAASFAADLELAGAGGMK